MFNANFANFTPNNSGYGMMNAFYAQARGNARRGGYNGGFQSGNQGGRNTFHTGRGMFVNSHPRGFPSGTGNFGNSHGRGQMIGNNKQMQFMRGQYNGNSGMPNSDGNDEQSVVCQICFKSGHTATECWHRFEENYVPQYMKKGRNQRSAYMAYHDAPTESSWSTAGSGMPQMHNPSFTPYMSDSVNLSGAGAEAAYVANFEGPADEGWYLDSGATHHLTNNMANMHVRDEFNGNDKLIIGNGKGLSITHIGSTTFSVQGSKSQAARKCITLKDILLVPSITKNLISVSKLTADNNLSIEFFGSMCYVKDSLKGKVLLHGIAEKGLYKLLIKSSLQPAYTSLLSQSSINQPLSMLSLCHFSSATDNACSANCFHSNKNSCTDSSSNKMSLFHRRFGHPNAQSFIHLLKLVHPNLLSANMLNQVTKHFCEACQLGKFHRLHLPITDIKSKSALELIHTDLWGPSLICSRECYRYYISFVDDHTI